MDSLDDALDLLQIIRQDVERADYSDLVWMLDLLRMYLRDLERSW